MYYISGKTNSIFLISTLSSGSKDNVSLRTTYYIKYIKQVIANTVYRLASNNPGEAPCLPVPLLGLR